MNDFVKRLAKLPAERRAEFLALLREEVEEPVVSRVPVAYERGPTGPLSFGQETLWFISRLAPDQPTYNTPIAFRLSGPLDVPALRRAVAAVVARHEMLRASLHDGPEGPEQTIHSGLPVEVALVEMAGADVEARRAAAEERMQELSRAVLPLDRAPLWRAELLRVAEDEHFFVLVVHHVVFDGWSLSVFCAELAEQYAGTEPAGTEPAARLDYGDYVRWQRDRLSGDTLQELTGFWRDTLAGAPVLEFPTDRIRPPEVSYRGTWIRRWVPLPAAGSGGVGQLARSLGTTPNALYTAAFVALMHRCSGQEDVVIGAPTANREHVELESVVGYFINMLALRFDVSGDPTYRQLVGRVTPVVQDAFAHGSLPFGKLVEAIRPSRDPSRSPVFQIVFTFQNTDGEFTLPGLGTERVPVDTGTSRFDMSWNVTECPTGLDLNVEFSTDLFDEETVSRLVAMFGTVLRAVLADPDLPLSRVPLLDGPERAALLADWNGPARPVPAVTVPEVFAAQVARDPDAVAVVSGAEQVSYAELDERSDRLANLLQARGAGPGRFVALCLPRQVDLVVAILAVLKSGAAYVPLDPAHPPARLAAVLADCAPVAVLTSGATGANLPDGPVIRLDADAAQIAAAPGGRPTLSAGPDDLAYAIYTSGSTGLPKGVLIEHRAVVNFTDSVRELFELTPADRVLGFAASTFDVSVFETFSALLTGARLYLAADDERLELDRLQELLVDSAITVTDLPPSLMALLEPERMPALRIAFVGGEAFPGELVTRWGPGRRFFNGYGPTECTVTMIVQECTGSWEISPPIGLPMANHVAHVLDAAGEPVPVGVPGELVIGGAGLARGYLNRPELTAEKFYPDPFGTAPGGRLYRTGDLVKRDRDGALVFLGRIDQQVKIRGLRIELGEIESVLSRLPEVAQVAVQPWSDGRGERHLVCYLAGRADPPREDAVREWLASQLPGYMVPVHYVVLPELPLTASGKVDRSRLPAPTPRDAGPAGPVEYADGVEQVIAEEIVAPVLGLARVEPEQNFFEMGGHSLAAARVVSRIRSRFEVELSLSDFFRAPNVRGLAALVGSRRAAATGDDALLAMLESMSDADAAALLSGDRGDGGP